MKKSLFLFIVLFLPLKVFAGYNMKEISNSRYVIYRAEDEEVLADITYSSRSWRLNCVNGVDFGSNNEKFDELDSAVQMAGKQCKI